LIGYCRVGSTSTVEPRGAEMGIYDSPGSPDDAGMNVEA
jgi:hypothetical protein